MSGIKKLLGDTPYPESPGSKTGGTSSDAAAAMAPVVGTLRERCLAEIKRWPGTSDEIAQRLGESVLSIRPRISELIDMGKVRKSPVRRENESGMKASVIECV